MRKGCGENEYDEYSDSGNIGIVSDCKRNKCVTVISIIPINTSETNTLISRYSFLLERTFSVEKCFAKCGSSGFSLVEIYLSALMRISSPSYLEQGIEETGAINFVAGMILDYRAFDTFGESNVLFQGREIPGKAI